MHFFNGLKTEEIKECGASRAKFIDLKKKKKIYFNSVLWIISYCGVKFFHLNALLVNKGVVNTSPHKSQTKKLGHKHRLSRKRKACASSGSSDIIFSARNIRLATL
jgi:hypothetical protein